MHKYSRRQFLERSATGVAATGLGVSSLFAQDWARQAVDRSPRRREWATVRHGDRAVESFIAFPQSPERAPSVIVIHEIFGMTDWVESVADEFAAAGYLAIAPDLLSGMGPNGGRTKDIDPNEVRRVIGQLPPDQITADLNSIADHCRKLPSCNGKVCVVGFSWGGGQCFRFATNRKDLSAAFVFYGSGPAPEAIPNIQAPVYGFYAGNDQRINDTIPQTEKLMKAAGKFYEVAIYEGAEHGFMRSGAQPGASAANRQARAAAWAKLKDLRTRFR